METVMNSNSILLSIIIPVYNCERYISDCLNSMTRQNFNSEGYEVIVVNDGSTDNTKEIIEQYSDRYEYIRVIDKINGGVSSARNVGIKSSKGKYITFMDADDYVVDNFYVDAVACMNQDGLDEFIFEATTNEREIEKFKDTYTKGDYKKLSQTVWQVIYKREIIERNGIYFVESIVYGEDVLFNYMYGQNAKIIGYSKVKAFFHRIHNSSVSSQLLNERTKRGKQSIIQNKQYINTLSICKEIKEYKTCDNFSQSFYEITLSDSMLTVIWSGVRTKIKYSKILSDIKQNGLSLKDIKNKIIEGVTLRLKLKSNIQFMCRKKFWLKFFCFIFKIFG